MERLDHPNVIKCYGHFWDHASGSLYMVLEYADAGDLYSHVLKRRTQKMYYDEGTIWVMFYQLCLGLNHLHSNGVIHRDIKSLNIMMCKDGMVKIGDVSGSKKSLVAFRSALRVFDFAHSDPRSFHSSVLGCSSECHDK